jgi:hypothetical protein
MNHFIRPAVFSLLLLTVLTGIIYPLCITGLAGSTPAKTLWASSWPARLKTSLPLRPEAAMASRWGSMPALL